MALAFMWARMAKDARLHSVPPYYQAKPYKPLQPTSGAAAWVDLKLG